MRKIHLSFFLILALCVASLGQNRPAAACPLSPDMFSCQLGAFGYTVAKRVAAKTP